MIYAEAIRKSFSGKGALEETTVDFPAGAISVLIGPSGCGKSTLLRILIGLIAPDAGRVLVNGEALGADNANRLRHGIGYVIQEGGLFPHLSAFDNVALLARYLRRGQAEIAQRVAQLTALARLDATLLAKFPHALSGGQRQRVALMRALMLDPPLLLLDEPLGALDPVTRYELQADLKHIFARLKKTVVLVTHDMNEAAHFADEIFMMREGRIVQRGGLENLLARPADPAVAAFIRAQRSDPRLERIAP
jgi:osmoprotectant transport system ATP-binding protein